MEKLTVYELTANKIRIDSGRRKKYLRDIADILLSLPGVSKSKVRASNHQLAWVQKVAGEKAVFIVFLVLYSPGVWRLACGHRHVVLPKSFWPDPHNHLYGDIHSFEWSFLPEQFDPGIVAKLLVEMARKGKLWDQDNFDRCWRIFPQGEHANYAWSVKATAFMAEKSRFEEEQKRLRLERRTARLAANSNVTAALAR